MLTDGDGQFGLSELPAAVRRMATVDAVLGYRRVRQDPWPRRFMGKCWTLLINLSLGMCVRDVDCAFKLVRADLLKRAGLRSRGALISTEMLASIMGAGGRVVQMPVEHLPRRTGRPSGANPKVVLRAFWELAASLPRLWGMRRGERLEKRTLCRSDRYVRVASEASLHIGRWSRTVYRPGIR